MKTYNSPVTQIVDCKASFMLMGNVSGGGFQGVKTGEAITVPIVIY